MSLSKKARRVYFILFLFSLVISFLFPPSASASNLTLQPGGEGKDSFVFGLSPGNFGSQTYLEAGGGTGTPPPSRTLIQFDLSSIPSGSTINSAILGLYLYTSFGLEPNLSIELSIHKITQEWQEDTVTFSNQPTFESNPLTSIFVGSPPSWVFWNVTSQVQAWVSGEVNYGLLIKGVTNSNSGKTFYSSDYSDPSLRPKLTIDYTPSGPLPDTTPPSISEVSVSEISQRGATISWKTNEESDSEVIYDGNFRKDGAFVTFHSLPISGLSPKTRYSFLVKSRDRAGNQSTSSLFSFMTLEEEPGPSPPAVLISENGYFEIEGLKNETKAGAPLPSDLKVTAKDKEGKTNSRYRGSIYFKSSDQKAVFTYHQNNRYTFTKKDKGVHIFKSSDFIFKTKGKQTFTITDDEIFTTYLLRVLQSEPKKLEIVSGNNQKTDEQKLKENLVVKVLDDFDNPCQDIEVFFTMFSYPEGAVGFTQEVKVKTDQNGLATTSFTLGDKGGDYRIKAGISKEKYLIFQAIYEKPPISIPQPIEELGKKEELKKTTKVLPGALGLGYLWPALASYLSNLPLINLFTLPFAFIYHFFLAFLEFLGLKKKRKPWGYVYDSQTKKPIQGALVRIFDKEGRLLATQSTDKEGRYGFLTKPGEYYLKVSKNNYIFPSCLPGPGYRGEIVKQKEKMVNLNIPLDPVFEVLVRRVSFFQKTISLASKLRRPLLILGSLSFFIVFLVNMTSINSLILALYLLFWLLEINEMRKIKSYGKVYDEKTEEPIDLAIVRAFEKEKNRLVSTKVTDLKGRFFFLVDKGNYSVSATKENFQPNVREIEAKEGIIVAPIPLKRIQG